MTCSVSSSVRAAAAALRADCVVAAGCTRRIGHLDAVGRLRQVGERRDQHLAVHAQAALAGLQRELAVVAKPHLRRRHGLVDLLGERLELVLQRLAIDGEAQRDLLVVGHPEPLPHAAEHRRAILRVGQRLVDARGEVEALDVEDERGRARADRQVAVDELARVVLQGLARLLRRHAGDVDAADDRALRQAAVRTGQRVADAGDQDHAQHRAEHEQPPATLPAARPPVAGLRARGRSIAVPWRSTSSGGPLRPSCRLQLPHGAHHCTKGRARPATVWYVSPR